MPLLLWRNRYYLGSPSPLSSEQIEQLSDRTATEICIVTISVKSYHAWFRLQKLDTNKINAEQVINPLTGEMESEDIGEITELFLSKAVDQISRIKTIISGALRNRASDIHLEPIREGLLVRYRIDGILHDITTLPSDISRRVIVALKVMCKMNIAESRVPQDARIGDRYSKNSDLDVELDMRVSTLPCINGEKAVIRLLPQENPFTNIKELGFTPPALEIYQNWLRQPQGMIIFTGPTGSGKTSTLYTSLQRVATERVNVVTVEDPVEYILPRITQTQVHEAAGMTFAAGMRAILRQDPDIIMVGEIRDHETAETAVRAALTGHLVLTTLHTNDVCPHCAVHYEPSAQDLNVLGIAYDQANANQWRVGKGCLKCFSSGYSGREAIVELLNVDDTVRQIIYEGTLTQLHRYLHKCGLESFRKAAIAKVTTGLTTMPEILRVLPYSAFNKRYQMHEGAPFKANLRETSLHSAG